MLPEGPSAWAELVWGTGDNREGAKEAPQSGRSHPRGRGSVSGSRAVERGEGVNRAGKGMVFAGTAQSTLAEGQMWIDRREVAPGEGWVAIQAQGGQVWGGRMEVRLAGGRARDGGPGGKLSDQNMRPEASWWRGQQCDADAAAPELSVPVGTEEVRLPWAAVWPSGGGRAATGCGVVLGGCVHQAMATILWSRNHGHGNQVGRSLGPSS